LSLRSHPQLRLSGIGRGGRLRFRLFPRSWFTIEQAIRRDWPWSFPVKVRGSSSFCPRVLGPLPFLAVAYVFTYFEKE
jgi:hypothetical protein